MTRASLPIAPLRTKNGLCAGEYGTYSLVSGAGIKVKVISVTRPDGFDFGPDGQKIYRSRLQVKCKVTSPTGHGYKRGEVFNLTDTCFLARRPMAGQPPNELVLRAMRGQGRSFLWHDAYGAGWVAWDRPPGNAGFYVVDPVR